MRKPPPAQVSKHAGAIHPSDWDKTRLRKTLAAMRGKKVLVIGDVGVDRYTFGSVERISPEAPVPIVLVQSEQLKLGLAANVADNVKVLGGVPLLVGMVGKDRTAQDFKGLLRDAGVSASHLIVDKTRRTVLKDRVVSERQQLLRIDFESQHGVERSVESAILKKVVELLPQVDGVIVEDYAKGMLSEGLLRSIFKAVRRARKLAAVDPNTKTPISHYAGTSILTPNTREAENLSGIQIRDDQSLLLAGRTLLKQSRARHVVITRGKDGMAIFTKGRSKIQLIPTYAREVYDVSGAGDTVISVLTLALASGASIEDASILGNLAAGVEVGKRGTATVSPEEILVSMEFFGTMSA